MMRASKHRINMDWLRQAVESLTQDEKELVVLRYMDTFDLPTCAEILELNPKEAEQLEEKALSRLAETKGLLLAIKQALHGSLPPDESMPEADLEWIQIGLHSFFASEVKAQELPSGLHKSFEELVTENNLDSLYHKEMSSPLEQKRQTNHEKRDWKSLFSSNFFSLATVSAVALLMVVPLLWSSLGNRTQHTNKDEFTTKGQPGWIRIQAFVSHRDPVAQKYLTRKILEPEQKLSTGDLIQIKYDVKSLPLHWKALHIMLVIVNERGTLQVGEPLNGERSALLVKKKGSLPLEGSPLSKKAPSFRFEASNLAEKWFLLVSKEHFTAHQVRIAVQRNFKEVGELLSALKEIKGPWKTIWVFSPGHRKKATQ